MATSSLDKDIIQLQNLKQSQKNNHSVTAFFDTQSADVGVRFARVIMRKGYVIIGKIFFFNIYYIILYKCYLYYYFHRMCSKYV